uniref:Uncharacterized protein n=1 Tax=Cannabis sativa TaxID=3483 RepID=A0A803PPI3_CANSA
MDKTNKPAVFNEHINWFQSSLKSVSNSNILYTYSHVVHGFSTRLTQNQAELLRKQTGVRYVLPEVTYKLHTTRTPNFLGLYNTTAFTSHINNKLASDVVIGVLDTGVWPESQSYNDKGLPPIPAAWKGSCHDDDDDLNLFFNNNFGCNRKLIGARFFSKGYEASAGPINQTLESKSPRDNEGHGTHTSATAAGSAVLGANLKGFASGTARGMAPTARIASYKVCWISGCFGSDVIAAVDKAIEDGVHILSMSFGRTPTDYYDDASAIATFAAMQRGIFVSASAGNKGPETKSVSNIAPWIMTVGAGTIDRDFTAYIRLGNGRQFKGLSSFAQPKHLNNNKWFPIVEAKRVSRSVYGGYCLAGTLTPHEVAGKIVICYEGRTARTQKSLALKDAGGAAMVYIYKKSNYFDKIVADADFVPTISIGVENINEIKRYLNSVVNPTATMMIKGTEIGFGVKPSPIVPDFSSRGPNPITPEIVKPDVIAPGVNILAAWSGTSGPTELSSDKRVVDFNIISGTSMACPHVSGIAALIKSVHPDWSPAAIKSALMTTSYRTDRKNGRPIQDITTENDATPFDYGSGHVDPVAAVDPGLVYDLTPEDYVWFLCVSDYTQRQIKVVTNRDINCEDYLRGTNDHLGQFNYPSFAVPFDIINANTNIINGSTSTIITHTRSLTNVGTPATYKVKVSKVESVKIVVNPSSLTFTHKKQKLAYTVTFTSTVVRKRTSQFGHLEWSDGKHIVGSPIAFTWS